MAEETHRRRPRPPRVRPSGHGRRGTLADRRRLTEAGRTPGTSSSAPPSTNWPFAAVWTSPPSRASDTCRLRGLRRRSPCRGTSSWSWATGSYEGRTTPRSAGERPGWTLWRDGVPGGETIDEVERASSIGSLAEAAFDRRTTCLLVAHGHVLARAGGARGSTSSRVADGCSRSTRPRSAFSATNARRGSSGSGTESAAPCT